MSWDWHMNVQEEEGAEQKPISEDTEELEYEFVEGDGESVDVES